MSGIHMGYWKIRGLGELVRLTLNYLKQDYEDEQFETPEQWFPTKFSRGIPFPNLPFLVDGDHKQTETTAIIEYLCAKYNPALLGTTPEERGTVSMLRNILMEANGKIRGLCYSQDSKDAVIKQAIESLTPVHEFMDGKKWAS